VAVEPLLPAPQDTHPLGCHRPRVPDRLCFWGILIRLVTGASWVDIEAILEHRVSDTTLRARRDEWIAAGVFDALKDEALAAFDRIIGLDLDDVALDGSLHKAPCGGEGTGPNPTDRAKLGWKWSVASDTHGVPIGWAIDGANRNDVKLLIPTLDAVAATGLLADVERFHLDRGYDSGCGATHARSIRHPRVRDPTPRHQGAGREEKNSRSGLDCDGSSKRPTPGGRTTASSAAAPTARTATATPRCASPPPSSSSASSSPGATVGAPLEPYPLGS
jgi:transposase